MANLTVGHEGEIALPDDLRERYALEPDTPIRIVETRAGILLIPLTGAPMDAVLAAELAEWQSLSLEAWNSFPYEDDAQ